jgi:hypothetical protein
LSGATLLSGPWGRARQVVGDLPDRGIEVARWQGTETDLVTLTGPGLDGEVIPAIVSAATRLSHTDPGTEPVGWDVGQLISEVGRPATGSAGCLFVVTSTVDVEDHEEFDAWFDSEHIPLLLRASGWRSARRYRLTSSSSGATHVALHLLDGPEVLDSPERAAAGSTEWVSSLAKRPWFSRTRRAVYKPVPGHPPEER